VYKGVTTGIERIFAAKLVMPIITAPTNEEAIW